MPALRAWMKRSITSISKYSTEVLKPCGLRVYAGVAKFSRNREQRRYGGLEMTEDSAALRRRTMQAVKSKDTKPELLVRRLVHAKGYRYRLHSNNLPGKPDLVLSGRKKVIFVHGCFWHGHDCARGARIPKTSQDYWIGKVKRNRDRDCAVQKKLLEIGWASLVIWECETHDVEALARRIIAFLH